MLSVKNQMEKRLLPLSSRTDDEGVNRGLGRILLEI